MSGDRTRVDYGTCPVCGYVMLPVLEMSPCGHEATPEMSSLDGEGSVYSWTRIRLGDEDRLMVMADFLDGRLRVTAPLVSVDSVAIGDRVELRAGSETPYELRRAG